jgi:alginate O-acetyltransferase complex protein AlgI
MLFNSYAFVFGFLPVALCVFFLFGHFNRLWAAAWLVLASIAFYGYWSPKYIPLLLGSVTFNFLAGRFISRNAGRSVGKVMLVVAITINLLLLGFYKYCDFFLTVANDVAGVHLPLLRIVLPIGISFFTFTQIAFLVDAHRGLAREYSFIHYSLFATYFPHLIAGPILHHSEIIPQFASTSPYSVSARSLGIGLTVFSIGLAKKVLIADPCGDMVSPIFAAAHDGIQIRLVAAWVGVLAYTFQLYFDFSGYTDMAIGISKLFGVDLPINFYSPYKSTSIIQFWQRWHMTLSRFLRDYLYFPLGGNRKGKLRRYMNLMITMLLGGLWHGANYTFVIWGGLHGCYLMINHAWRSVVRPPQRASFVGTLGAGTITFLAVVIAWVFFRAEDVSTAFNILSGMAGINGIAVHDSTGKFWQAFAHLFPRYTLVSGGALQLLPSLPTRLEMGSLFLGAGVLSWAMPNTRQLAGRIESACETIGAPSTLYRYVFPSLSGLLLVFTLSQMQKASTFLYFQF